MKNNKNIVWNVGCFFICSIVFYMLFQQSLNQIAEGTNVGIYASDMYSHIKFTYADNGLPYSLLHQSVIFLSDLIRILGGNASENNSNTALMIIIVLCSFFITALLIRDYLEANYNKNLILLSLASLSLLIVSMIIIPGVGKYNYLGVGSPNPWHNPTYIFSKPFCIFVFLFSIRLIKKDNLNYKSHLYFVMAILLGVWAKPSFFISFLPTIALVFTYLYLKKKISFNYYVKVGFLFSLSLIPIFIINQFVYHAEKSSDSIIFVIGDVWSHYTSSIILSIILSCAFPLYIVVRRNIKMSLEMKVALINFVFSTLVFFFLAEDGKRMYHLNFGWTYYYGLFFMFLFGIKELLLNRDFLGWLIYALHVLSGVYYFSKISLGYIFY